MRVFYAIAIAFILTLSLNTQAAYFQNQPYQITQPNGTTIDCFVSGDEFFNWLHDEEGYTIVQAENGYFYYAVHDKERIVASEYLVESINPAAAGLKPWVKISKQEYQRRKQAFEVDDPRSTRAPHQGAFNNPAIYIRFSDDAEFTNNRQYYDNIFNLGSGSSVKTYFAEVSYNMLDVNTTHYPECAMTTNLSYTDSHPRKYYEEYNATTNPIGYNGMSERTFREHTLLKNAVNWININSPIPSGLNIDGDQDGMVDNVCFIIRGGTGAWASLLWAHRWALYTEMVYINGKRVYDYTFQPETQVTVQTLCHEFFHALGAPDLYHYNDGGLQLAPVGPWDLMESGGAHMGAYMKWKYTNNTWISSIPEITSPGTYTLNPLSSSTNNCYKIASPNSTSQYFVLEYRQKTGTYESGLPGSGLLVYRIDPAYNGNADGPPDEVYIYRPGGTPSINGDVGNAYYSQQSGRTVINDGTNPSSFLQNGNAGGLNISNVTASAGTISFTVGMSSVQDPGSFTATAASESQINLQWLRNTSQNNVMLAYNTSNTFGSPADGTSYSNGNNISGGGTVLYLGSAQSFQHINLNAGTTYYYKIWSVDGTNTYSSGASASAHTNCNSQSLPFSESFNGALEIPVCWEQQINGNNVTANWSTSPTNNAGGSTGELMSSYQSVSAGINRLVLPVFNTTGMSGLNLSFKHMLDAYGAGVTLKVQSSSNGNTWTNEAWVLQSGDNNVGPATVNTTIASNLNSPITYVAFTVQGNLYQYNYWYIDDISLTNSTVQTYNISTTSNPAAGGTISGGGTYNQGVQATVIATTNNGYTFTNWTENGNVVSGNASYSFTVQGNRSLVANFAVQNYIISANVSPANSGIINGTGSYTYGSYATLSATSNNGYTFTNWTENGTVVSVNQNYIFMVTGNRMLMANFAPIQYTISISANPANGGSVSGGGSYGYGSQATVTATAADGWNFTNWTENGTAVSTSANYSFTVNKNRTLVANFTQAVIEYTITTSSSPANGGATQGGGTYEAGQTVTLTATPASSWNFVEWTEDGTPVSGSATYSFIAQSDRNLVANFAMEQFEVTLMVNPANAGTVTGAGWYDTGNAATVVASPSVGYNFVAWTLNGNVVSTQLSYTFTVTTNLTLTAEFELQAYTIQTTSNPTEGGTTTGAGTYNYGQTATLLASASTLWEFTGWKENGTIISTQPTLSFVVNANRVLEAGFVRQYTVSAIAVPTDGGEISGAGVYREGETAELRAKADQNYAFVDWKENGNTLSTEPQLSFVVNIDRDLVAHFKLTVGIVMVSKPECKLYPNPAKGVCFIETNEAAGKIISINISGITGNVVMDVKQPLPTHNLTLDLSAQAESVYFVKIITDKGHFIIKKLILQK